MNILIVGGGGREHALAWKAIQSRHISTLHVAPGNPGVSLFSWVHPNVAANDIAGQVELAKKISADLVIVGPEDPLAAGLVDALTEAGFKAFGPTKAAARIESSKDFAKELMTKAGVPTASYGSFTEFDTAWAYVELQGAPIVVKADGLAAGKGVTVCISLEEARTALTEALAIPGGKVVVEEFLEGEEVSVLAFSDGRAIKQCVAAQDHKRIGENDTGPNTGGMGTYAPVPTYTPEIAAEVQKRILEPVIRAMAAKGTPFVGCLFAGLMLTKDGPKVIEFNCRFGDPETEVVMPLLESDLIEVALACVEGRLDQLDLKFKDAAAACVMVASAGYPGKYFKGLVINGVDEAERRGATVFHAGTWIDEEQNLITNGGRVLGVMGTGRTVAEALEMAYYGVEPIDFEGKTYRRDIGWRAVGRR